MNLPDYVDWSFAYRCLNQRLFENQLPEVAFTLSRKANSLGYAAMDRFTGRTGETSHELAMNPDHLLVRSDLEVLGTLAHEMCHIWQFVHGKPSGGGHHNHEWGDKMESIGLMPSNTGLPGGKRTGKKMTHYIIKMGLFIQAAQHLLEGGWCVNRGSRSGDAPAKKKDPSKTKFTCPCCGQNAWAKREALLLCGECDSEPMEMAA